MSTKKELLPPIVSELETLLEKMKNENCFFIALAGRHTDPSQGKKVEVFGRIYGQEHQLQILLKRLLQDGDISRIMLNSLTSKTDD